MGSSEGGVWPSWKQEYHAAPDPVQPRYPEPIPSLFEHKYLYTMAHSRRKQKQIEKREWELQRRIGQFDSYRKKILATASIKTRDDVSLSDLRDRFRPRHHELAPTVKAWEKKFKRYRSKSNKPLVIYGKDGGLLVCRIRLKDQDLTKDLVTEGSTSISLNNKHRSKGIIRGKNEVRHYGLWCAYAQVPFVTSEQRLDSEKADVFLKSQGKLFSEMTDLLGAIAPSVFKDYQKYPIVTKEGPVEHPCGPWSACVVNRGWDDPPAGNIHRDVKESQYGYSCIAVCGDYEGGDLILWDLAIKIQLVPSDLLLFPDSLIHHSNEAVRGIRHSIVVFTQENMYDYWKRDFGMYFKKHQKKERKKEWKKSRKVIGKRKNKN
jgi:hypothetical protein